MEARNINPNKTDRVISKAIDDSQKEADDCIRLSTGVVLRTKTAPTGLLIRIMTKIPRPEPPEYFNEAMGRWMVNPDDPDYISRVQAWQMDYANGMQNALIGYGTELVSIPNGMEGPHPTTKKKKEVVDGKTIITEIQVDPSWIREYRELGLPTIADSPSWRYQTWVMFKAGPSDTDLKMIQSVVKSKSGVPEADVRDAETFSDGDEAGRGDPGNGHKV